MEYYNVTVTMSKKYVIRARDPEEAEDKAFLLAWDVLPSGYEVGDLKAERDEEGY